MTFLELGLVSIGKGIVLTAWKAWSTRRKERHGGSAGGHGGQNFDSGSLVSEAFA